MRKFVFVLLLTPIFLLFASSDIHASHSWGYHWGRTTNPFTLKLGDNLSSSWDSHFQAATGDWSQSSKFDMQVIKGSTTPRSCRPKKGQVEVCNYKYGKNGWLGLTQIWTTSDHMTQATVKVNDTYFNTNAYNTLAWKRFSICHELGHTVGLDHPDEDFYNTPLGTCMDYSADPVPNQYPNGHDFEVLDSIYEHLDSTNTVGATSSGSWWGGFGGLRESLDSPSDWGQRIRKMGRNALYERNFGGGNKVFTFVTLVE